MPTVLIISLGGTPEPVVASIETHRPAAVCFFASDQSVDKVGEIKARLRERGVAFRDAKVLCDDVDDLIHCYERALTCDERLKQLVPDVSPHDVVVDYTGGTKTMTAALALATVGKGYGFSYVGGKERTKEGLGTVISGTETVKTGISPWQLFAVEEKQRIALYFNRYQFAAALAAVEHLPEALPPKERRLFDCLGAMIEGYAAWDRFDHKSAAVKIGSGLSALRPFCDAAGAPPLSRFCEAAQANLAFLQTLLKAKPPDRTLAVDLLSNAGRRAEEGKYDDAVARLYRTLELIGQIAFREHFDADTGKVKPEALPEPLREAYAARYRDERSGLLKLPAYATFRALAEAAHPAGLAYFEAGRDLHSVLTTRNDSILAHGTTPVKPEAFERLESLIRYGFDIREEIRFPALELSP